MRLAVALLGAALLCGGCATPGLERGRAAFYRGQFDTADEALADLSPRGKDAILQGMERGMVRHLDGRYEASTTDWLRCVARIRDLHELSVSRGTTSMVVNDTVLTFRGAAFEQVLLHSFLAQNFLLARDAEGAAVEARNAIHLLEQRATFPDDAFSRYLAGLCLELAGDAQNARVQYRIAAELSPAAGIDPETGRLQAAATPPAGELICIVGLGRTGVWYRDGRARYEGHGPRATPVATITVDGRTLGTTTILADTDRLYGTSQALTDAFRTGKTLTRIAIKEAIAESIAEDNPMLSELVRALLYATEVPDQRRWRTLPRWLGIARFPLHAPATDVRITSTHNGAPRVRQVVVQPLARIGATQICVAREL